ncbi:MAG: DUF4149 domain-containing protein [Gemmatimonadota bacterium]|nr:DUF4149 domain-containing protein [Gemmatimonadota bacterium]
MTVGERRSASRRLRMTVVVLLSGWLGAAILFAAVLAPAAFRLLPSAALAGGVIGGVLPPLFLSGFVCGGALGAVAIGLARDQRRSPCFAAGVLMAAACAGDQLVVGRAIERVRGSIGGPVGELAANDPRRVAFGRLHGLSIAMLALAMAGAGSGLAMLLPSTHSREDPGGA